MPTLAVSELLQRREPIALTCDFAEIAQGCRVSGQMTVVPNGQGFRLRGALRGEVDLLCDRCLRAFTRPLDIPINETFWVRPSGKHADVLDVADGISPDELLDERDTLDLDDLARQWALLETAGQCLCADPACQY